MSIKKFYSVSDTTITNAYKGDLSTRAINSNMGLSDSLEVFFIFGQSPDENAVLAQKLEESRIVIKFNIDDIRQSYNSQFPSDTKFIFKLSNAEHPYTLARNYKIKVYSLTSSFSEGNGLDMESYLDEGVASWVNRENNSPWQTPGALDLDVNGDIVNSFLGEQNFDTGEENLEIDITNYVKGYFDDLALVHNGFAVVIDGDLTSGASEQNYYTKKFFSRSSQYFFKRPVIESRSSKKLSDDRGKFYIKSSVLSQEENTQRIYLYNLINGELRDFTFAAGQELYVKLYTDSEKSTLTVLDPASDFVEATRESLGVYYVDLVVEDPGVDKVYEEWFVAADGTAAPENKTIVHDGEISLKKFKATSQNTAIEYVSNIVNLKNSYTGSEVAKFRVYTRPKDWSPTIYTVASKKSEPLIVQKMYYKIVRLVDDEDVIPYGIGSTENNNEHTLLSYDASGSYFDFDMSLLEKGYMYGIKLLYSVNNEIREQNDIFKFRID